jgi:hypothetical protein
LQKSETFSAMISMLGQKVDRFLRVGSVYRRFVIANQGAAASDCRKYWSISLDAAPHRPRRPGRGGEPGPISSRFRSSKTTPVPHFRLKNLRQTSILVLPFDGART